MTERGNDGRRRMGLRIAFAVAACAAVLAGGSPAFADKLVVFKNGKAMRVKSVQKDGTWLRCEFDNNDFLSVPANRVASIEDASAASPGKEVRVNQVAAGSGSPYQPPQGQGSVGMPDNNAQVQNIENAGVTEEPGDADVSVVGQGQPANGRAGFGNMRRGRGVGRSSSINAARTNSAFPGGLQQLNPATLGNPQAQQQNRGLKIHRSTVRPPPTAPPDSGSEESEN